MAMVSKVLPCIVAPSQKSKMYKGKNFKYHLRATTKSGSFTNKTLCGNRNITGRWLFSYTDLHNAYGIASLCSYCRNRSLG